jgi:crotonobetainyl-CoA:carnitine CoA-transferase CaiB-like acyl-CoA transferase
MKLSRTAAGPRQGAPALGEHTVEILSALLGMDKKEIEELESLKVIGTAKR